MCDSASEIIERPQAGQQQAAAVADTELTKALREEVERTKPTAAAAPAPLANPVRRVTVRVSVERSHSSYSHSDEFEDEFCFEGPFPVAFLASQVRLAASLSAERIERMLGGGAE